MNNAVLIQQCSSLDSCTGEFHDMLRLTMQRHAAYARSHQMDYWLIFGDTDPRLDWHKGAWPKIPLIKRALEQGYEWVFWVDADAAIVKQDDLREALSDGKLVGGVEHYAPWFEGFQIPRHINVGVLFFRNAPLTKQFIDAWLDAYPGEPRWAEQGTFNKLIVDFQYADVFQSLPAKYNATVNVHHEKEPVIIGWHGVAPLAKRLELMKAALFNDFLKFKVV
jgi:hypothetical protein